MDTIRLLASLASGLHRKVPPTSLFVAKWSGGWFTQLQNYSWDFFAATVSLQEMCNITSLNSYSSMASSSELGFSFPFPSAGTLLCHQCLIIQAFLFSVFKFLQPRKKPAVKKGYIVLPDHTELCWLYSRELFSFFEAAQCGLSLNWQICLIHMTSLCFLSVTDFELCIKIPLASFLNFLVNNVCNSLQSLVFSA